MNNLNPLAVVGLASSPAQETVGTYKGVKNHFMHTNHEIIQLRELKKSAVHKNKVIKSFKCI